MHGYAQKEEKKVMIVVGANETLETRQMKDFIKKKAAEGGFLDKKL